MGKAIAYRFPQTKNEMKQYYTAIDVENGVMIKVRGKRRAKNLPHLYDDQYRHGSRCWKDHRRVQWR